MLSGAQGIGKSTAVSELVATDPGLCALGIDDFYLPREERLRLAREVHPLFETRGPPGTHDLPLLKATLDRLNSAQPGDETALPVFSKRMDDRLPMSDWRKWQGRPQIILLEGWLMGALPDEGAPTDAPMNMVEAEDQDGIWRSMQEAYLRIAYARLWDRADAFCHLRAPGFETILNWRVQQEAGNQGVALEALSGECIDWVRRFIQHYERITRRMLAGGHRAGYVIGIDENRQVLVNPALQAKSGLILKTCILEWIMKIVQGFAALVLAVSLGACGNGDKPEQGDEASMTSDATMVEERFAKLALDCIHRPYPNKISHMMTSDEDIATPQQMTPAFYGCFDWHSAVHGHWLLVRILKTHPETPMAEDIRAALATSFTEDNLSQELAYYSAPDRAGFERPYGIAWYLQLVAELDESEDPQLLEWRETLRPLENKIVERVTAWLPKLAYPNRIGTHNQTAFAFGLMLDYARTVGDEDLELLITEKALAFHRNDKNCPLSYEPSGEDFLSPCLMEADLMRRVMPEAEYAVWLGRFLPDIPLDAEDDSWLEPGVVLDPEDGKLVHLDGVNLSRAWALEGIASALPEDDPRRGALLASAEKHKKHGIAAVSAEHYSGSHWLASFATYLTTQRGISEQ